MAFQSAFGVGAIGNECAGGIPDEGSGPFEPHRHIGTPMFHGLELTDRTAELLAFAGVGGGRLYAPCHRAHPLFAREHCVRHLHQRRHVAELSNRRHLDTDASHLTDCSRGIGGGQGRNADARLLPIQQHPGECANGHGVRP